MASRARRPTNIRELILSPGSLDTTTTPFSPTKRPWSRPTVGLGRILCGLLCIGLLGQVIFWRFNAVDNHYETDNETLGPGRLRTVTDAAPNAQETAETHGMLEPRAHGRPYEEENEQQRRARYDPSLHTEDQKKVVEMIQWAWKGYATYAYGYDALNVQTFEGLGVPDRNMALTLVDSLDTLYLVGMFHEFDRATEWVATNMEQRILRSGFISMFETTIRVMGGLLSAYYMSGHDRLLVVAKNMGLVVSPAFDEYDHGIPAKDFDAATNRTRNSPSIAEVGSLQLEYKYLARVTGYAKFGEQVDRISDLLAKLVDEKYTNGLLPVDLDLRRGTVVASKITLGAKGDSYYEYLLKQWLLSGKKDDKFRTRYITAVDGIMDKLVGTSKPNGLKFVGELEYGKFSPKMDHLACFVPGMLALGYLNGMPEKHFTLAKQLMETCYQMYAQMETKLAPEIIYFNMNENVEEDLRVNANDDYNFLRPETVESLMVLYRVTKDEKYREYGREIMKAFEKNCRLERGGYASVGNVAKGPVQIGFYKEMESFFISETLKYLFLLLSNDSVLALDDIVFNTEAHPFPINKADS